MVKVSSSLAVAAYRHCTALTHEGERPTLYDFTKKQHVIYSELIFSDGAPAGWDDRQTLYNELEAVEDKSTRPKTAQLLREIEVQLPWEVWEHSRDKAIDLVRGYASEQAKKFGTFTDFAIHCPDGKEGPHPHAHILVGLRPLTAEGFGDKSDERTRFKLDHALRATMASLKNAGKAKEALAVAGELTINKIRQAWEDAANQALTEVDAVGRVDRRTLEAQREDARARGNHRMAAWLDRVPQTPIGMVRRLGRAAFERARERVEAAALSKHRQQARAPALASGGDSRARKARFRRFAVFERAQSLERHETPALNRGPALER